MSNQEQWSVIRWILVGVGLLTALGVAAAAGFAIGFFATDGRTETVTVGPDGRPASTQISNSLLAELPEASWATNGGSLSNERYSPLDEINTDNVKDVKGEWEAHLDGSGVAAKYSGEATPVVHDGVIYTITGANDVFAHDVETGEEIWKYEGKLDQTIDTVCCGWTSRGVGLGEGLVYVGRLDGKLVALDQADGRKVWEVEVGSWRKGETITSAPLYYDGRVYTGLSGGEYGIRGRLTAYDARTGRLLWRFWTVPGPDQLGHNTWPDDNDSWKVGGAPVWQTPSVDPELGMIYFSTGNASPDWSGAAREGDNLFAASIVALDVKTGKHRWHFQQVHHDIWDYDAPSPTVLFDAEIDGEEVKGISQPGKTGWLYMLDRRTGKPIHPIEEREVPQSEEQKTSPTQPFPSNPPFVQHEPTDEQVADIEAIANKGKKGKKRVKVLKGKIFDPFDDTLKVFSPGAQGGNNWPPSSYNRDTQMVYVCGENGAAAYSTGGPGKHVPGEAFYGSIIQLTGFAPHPGVIAAIDVTTGKIAWRKILPSACYSGTTTTAGNLVFVGHNDGTLRAYNAENGDELWKFQLGAGANATPAIFEHEGKQRIAFYAAGNSLIGNAHGDSLWMLSLDGQLEQAKPGASMGGTTHAGEETEATEETPEEEESRGEGDDPTERESEGTTAELGQTLFSDNCSVCHGAQGGGGNGGPNIIGLTDEGNVRSQIENGGDGMPPFKNTLTPDQISDLVAYVMSLK